MSEENEFNMYKNIVNNYFRTETFEKAKDFCVRDMMQLNHRYITEAVCRNEALNRANELEKLIYEIICDIENDFENKLTIEDIYIKLSKYSTEEINEIGVGDIE